MTVATYARHVAPKATPQTQAIFGTNQVQNSAGGFTWAIDDFARLDRFLILGAEGGTYYASENKLTRQNAECVIRCGKADARRTVERIVEISEQGRAPKNDPAIFALALLAGSLAGNTAASLALRAMPKVCRTGTMLFDFIAVVTQFRGWGRALRTAVSDWYAGKKPDQLALQVTKYQQRNGWSHRDLLRLSHPTLSAELSPICRWVVGGMDGLDRTVVVRKFGDEQRTDFYYRHTADELPDLIRAFEEAKTVKTEDQMVRLIREEKLVHEHVPSHFLASPAVWEALLPNMPPHALVRNLGRMSANGLLKPLSNACKMVCDKLGNVEALKKSRMHPMALLFAQKVYEQGHGNKGKLSWSPVSQVVDALNDAFYAAFQTVTPTNKRWLLALDVSGSMASHSVLGSSMTAREASAAMALVTAAVEPQHHIVGFTSTGGYSFAGNTVLTPLSISPKQRLTDVVRRISNLPFGGTDCALPMLYAIQRKLEVDAFVIYTDNETAHGKIHPSEALRAYRDKMGIDAKLIVAAMSATNFSIADPNDRGMLDIAGFDSAAPAIMSDFVLN